MYLFSFFGWIKWIEKARRINLFELHAIVEFINNLFTNELSPLFTENGEWNCNEVKW